jgi:hypothetical protein
MTRRISATSTRTSRTTAASGAILIRRKCGCSGKSTSGGATCAKCAEDENLKVRRKSGGRRTVDSFGRNAPNQVRAAIAGGGRPLDRQVRERFEGAMGHDLSHVRIHTDAVGAASAAAIDAEAYTAGSHVVFGAGKYDPSSKAGAWLLVHELAHTLQDSRPGAQASLVDVADSSEEREADSIADAVVRGRRAQTGINPARASGGILRRNPLTTVECGEAGGGPLSPALWKRCTNQKVIQKENSYPLRIDESGEIATPEALVEWAFRKNYTGKQLRTKFNSSELAGSGAARDAALAAFNAAMAKTSFDARISLLDEMRGWELWAKQQADLEKAQKDAAAAVEAAIEDYYTVGERLKPKGARLLTIAEAAKAEREGRKAGARILGAKKDRFYHGLSRGRFTVVDPFANTVKINSQYYFDLGSSDELFDVMYGVQGTIEQVYESTKGINVAYGYLMKYAGKIMSLSNNKLAQLMGPAIETAGEGMLYDVRKTDARLKGEEFNERAPEITWRTAMEGLANVAGNKFGGAAEKFVGKYSRVGGKVAGVVGGLEASNVIVKGYDFATGQGSLVDVFVPDLSPVEFLETMIVGHVLHKFSDRWIKGKAPKVPADVHVTEPTREASKLPTEKIEANKRAAQAKEKSEAAARQPAKGTATEKKGGSTAARKSFEELYKPIPPGVAPTLDAFRSRWNPKHHVELTERGLERCSPGPCPLLRQTYKREIRQNSALEPLITKLEQKRWLDPKNETLRKQSAYLETKLAERHAVNSLLEAIPEPAFRDRARAVVESGIGLDGEQVDAFTEAFESKKTPAGRQQLVIQMERLALESAAKRGSGRNQDLSPDITQEIDAAFAPPDPKSAAKAPAKALEKPAPGTGTANLPSLETRLPLQAPSGDKFTSQYKNAPQPADSEVTVGRTLETTPYTWMPQERIHHPQSDSNLMSTVPEYFSENVGGNAVSVEVKNVAVSGLEINFDKWAEQLARRNLTIARSYPHLILKNWLFVDLRGLRVEVDLPKLAARINEGISEAGRVGREPGARYDRIHFILDTKVVRMP